MYCSGVVSNFATAPGWMGGVAEVVRHHDGRVETATKEVKRRNRHIVVSFAWVNDGSALVVLLGGPGLVGRDQQVLLHRLPQQLRYNLDLLALVWRVGNPVTRHLHS